MGKKGSKPRKASTKYHENCHGKYGPSSLSWGLETTPTFQVCYCSTCPKRAEVRKLKELKWYWFYWPYDGIHDWFRSAKNRTADWEPVFILTRKDHPNHFFLVSTCHWEHICWGRFPQHELLRYQLSFAGFWHTPMIEDTFRQTLNYIHDKLTGWEEFARSTWLRLACGLERIARWVRKLTRRHLKTARFSPEWCLFNSLKYNENRDPMNPKDSFFERETKVKRNEHEIKVKHKEIHKEIEKAVDGWLKRAKEMGWL